MLSATKRGLHPSNDVERQRDEDAEQTLSYY